MKRPADQYPIITGRLGTRKDIMCDHCMAEVVWEAGGQWPLLTPTMIETSRLIKEFYAIPGCGTGGPLHIVTDDSNIGDSHLSFCWGKVTDTSWFSDHQTAEETEEMVKTGCAILWGLGAMTLAERAVTVELDSYRGAGGSYDAYPPDGWDLEEMFGDVIP